MPENNVQQVAAVALKLPPFWAAEPDLWFLQVEAQFQTRNPPLTNDLTKYNHVLQALHTDICTEIAAVIRNPPEENKYDTLKSALIDAFGRTPTQRSMELLTMSGLGDRRPTALLRRIEALQTDVDTLMRALFLSQLPADVRQVLAPSTASLRDLAKEADRVMEARAQSSIPLAHSSGSALLASVDQDSDPSLAVDAVGKPFRRFDKTSQPSKSTPNFELCYFHQRFGTKAKRCKKGSCPMQSSVNRLVDASPKTLSVYDRLSGKMFLVDSGADVSVLPATASQRKIKPSFHMKAANGSNIAAYSKVSVPLKFKNISFTHDFLLADVQSPILGIDFLLNARLAFDPSGKKLIHLDTAATIPLMASATSATCSVRRIERNQFESILDDYPQLLITLLPNMTSSTIFRLKDPHSRLNLAAYLQKNLLLLETSSTIWNKWESSVSHRPHGPHRFTWSQRRMARSGHAGISVD